jgi:hypothetical protein
MPITEGTNSYISCAQLDNLVVQAGEHGITSAIRTRKPSIFVPYSWLLLLHFNGRLARIATLIHNQAPPCYLVQKSSELREQMQQGWSKESDLAVLPYHSDIVKLLI